MTKPVQLNQSPTVYPAPAYPASLDPGVETTAKKVKTVFWYIFCTIIFPVGLALLIRYGLFCLAARAVIPAAFRDKKADLERSKFLFTECGWEQFFLTTPDKVKLDAAIFKGTKFPNKVILFSPGNGVPYACTSHIHFLKATGCSVIALNPRGVGESGGYPDPQGFGLDVYTAYEYCINVLGMDPEDVLVYGHSLGGVRNNLGAALIQAKYADKKIPAMNDRSLATMTTTTQNLVKNFVERSLSCCRCLGKVLGFLAGLLAKLLLWCSGWEMHSKAAWDKLQGRKCIIYSRNDEIIDMSASLYRATRQDNTHPEVIRIKMGLSLFGDAHCREFWDAEVEAVYRQIYKILKLPILPRSEVSAEARFLAKRLRVIALAA